MKIEAGKYYRTRDGQKVGPMRENDVPTVYRWSVGFEDGAFWDDSGCGANARSPDLIAEWTEPTRDDLTAELAALDARKAEVQAQLDKMPEVYRAYWGVTAPDEVSRSKYDTDTHYLEWIVDNGVPRVSGDFKRIGE